MTSTARGASSCRAQARLPATAVNNWYRSRRSGGNPLRGGGSRDVARSRTLSMPPPRPRSRMRSSASAGCQGAVDRMARRPSLRWSGPVAHCLKPPVLPSRHCVLRRRAYRMQVAPRAHRSPALRTAYPGVMRAMPQVHLALKQNRTRPTPARTPSHCGRHAIGRHRPSAARIEPNLRRTE